MNPKDLAPIYLDDEKVELNEPRPKVSSILSAFGRGDKAEVHWLAERSAKTGKPLQPHEVVDRTTDPTKPIYLTSDRGDKETDIGAE